MGWEDLDKAWGTVEPAKEAGGFALVPDGTSCKLVIIEQGPHTKKKKTGDSYSIKTIFEVVEPAEYAGVRVWQYFGISEKNLAYVKRDLNILGWKGDKISALMNADNSTLIGLGCLAVLGVDDEESIYIDKTTGEEKKSKKKNYIKVIKEGWRMPRQEAQAQPGAPSEPHEDDGTGFKPPF